MKSSKINLFLGILLLLIFFSIISTSQCKRNSRRRLNHRRYRNTNHDQPLVDDFLSNRGTCRLEVSCTNPSNVLPITLPIQGPQGPPGQPGSAGEPGEAGIPGQPDPTGKINMN